MTDYRDPNHRDPSYRNASRDGYRDSGVPASSGGWSMATWGWIAGFAVVALLLILAFGMSGTVDRVAKDDARTPTTTGQGTATPATKAPDPFRAPITTNPPAATTPAPTPPAKQ